VVDDLNLPQHNHCNSHIQASLCHLRLWQCPRWVARH